MSVQVQGNKLASKESEANKKTYQPKLLMTPYYKGGI